MDNQKNFWQIVKEASILISIGVISLIVLNFTTDIFKTAEKETIIEKPIIYKPKSKPSEYPDYDSLSEMNSLVLVENFEAYVSDTSDEKDKNKNTINGIISKNGKISKGYLEIIASVNNKPLTIWESIYFKAPTYDTINHGGHIFRPESLKFPPDIEKGEKTHLLFPLNYIPFLPSIPYSESAKPLHFDLFDTINKFDEVVFLAFISSNTPAKIDLIKIHYECDKDVNDGECELMLKKINKILE